MSSRPKSPEKRIPSNLRDVTHSDQFRSGIDAANRRLDRGNPQTPPAQRFASSTYSSPGSILGREEDAIIVELSSRYLTAGIEGESYPQCKINFCPESNRRIGDYRQWYPGHNRTEEDINTWGNAYELWRNDLHGSDMDLTADRLERSMGEAYNKHLLVDIGSARMVLVLPSLVPHPVLNATLSTLFMRWKHSSITLLPAPTMAAFSAGLRSALIIDINWEETIVTAVHEYRELQARHSMRGMKSLTRKLARSLQKIRSEQKVETTLKIDLPFVEEVLTRALPSLSFDSEAVLIPGDEQPNTEETQSRNPVSDDKSFEVEWPSNSTTKLVQVPCHIVLRDIEESLLIGVDDRYADHDELCVSRLAFEVLMALSGDTRMACTPRIVFTGQLATHSSLTRRIIHDLRDQIVRKGWSSVKGQRMKEQASGRTELAEKQARPADARHGVEAESGKDYIEDRVRQSKAKRRPVTAFKMEPQQVESLGSWVGASLLTSLKVRGFVEIERDRYLSHGIHGAARDAEISVVAQPQRISSFGLPKATKAQDRTSWTLAGWG